jgi:Protein of unknown function (DUF2510)
VNPQQTPQKTERIIIVTQPNMPPPSDPTPGFYPDSQGVMRLWDGQRWTEVTRPMPQPPTGPAGQPGYYTDSQGVMRWWTGRDWAPHTQPPQPKKKRGFLVWLPLTIVLLLASCGALITLGDTDDTTDTSTVEATDDAAPTDEPTEQPTKKSQPKPAATTVTDGDYLVGKEIKTGTWKTSKVPDEGAGLCYADTQTKKATSSNKSWAQKANP